MRLFLLELVKFKSNRIVAVQEKKRTKVLKLVKLRRKTTKFELLGIMFMETLVPSSFQDLEKAIDYMQKVTGNFS